MSEGPKLYTNKPKKAQLKQCQEQQKGKDFSSPLPSSSMATQPPSSLPPPPPPPPPSQPPSQSFSRRYKFLWPMLLTVNLAVGAYLFMRTKKKDVVEEEGHETPVSTTVATTAPVIGTSIPFPTVQPAKLQEPFPEDQQCELFKWMLQEKRKIKPKDPKEKKRIDEEKAILKELIRAKSIPKI